MEPNVRNLVPHISPYYRDLDFILSMAERKNGINVNFIILRVRIESITIAFTISHCLTKT